MLVKMAEAIGRVVLAGRELTRLAGSVLFIIMSSSNVCNIIVQCSILGVLASEV